MIFCRLGIFFIVNFSINFLKRNTIRVSNSLDPDQDQHFVRPYLCPDHLQRFSAPYSKEKN